MRRRLLSAALVAGLVLLVPAPVSVCALLAGLPGECAPSPESDCSRMGLADSSESLAQMRAGSAASCCSVSQAAIPQVASKISAPAAGPVLELAQQMLIPPSTTRFASPHLEVVHSPPDRQQFLCVFLI